MCWVPGLGRPPASKEKEVGLLTKEYHGVKVLGRGKLEKKLTVQANKFSKSAEDAIKAAGGNPEVI